MKGDIAQGYIYIYVMQLSHFHFNCKFIYKACYIQLQCLNMSADVYQHIIIRMQCKWSALAQDQNAITVWNNVQACLSVFKYP